MSWRVVRAATAAAWGGSQRRTNPPTGVGGRCAAFEAVRAGFAAGLGGAAPASGYPDLPAAVLELRIVEHVAALADVVEQAVGGLVLGRAAEGGHVVN